MVPSTISYAFTCILPVCNTQSNKMFSHNFLRQDVQWKFFYPRFFLHLLLLTGLADLCRIRSLGGVNQADFTSFWDWAVSYMFMQVRWLGESPLLPTQGTPFPVAMPYTDSTAFLPTVHGLVSLLLCAKKSIGTHSFLRFSRFMCFLKAQITVEKQSYAMVQNFTWFLNRFSLS